MCRKTFSAGSDPRFPMNRRISASDFLSLPAVSAWLSVVDALADVLSTDVPSVEVLQVAAADQMKQAATRQIAHSVKLVEVICNLQDIRLSHK
jgi:hypothetical protein